MKRQVKPFLCLSLKLDDCAHKYNVHKSRDVISKCKFVSISQLIKNLFAGLCSKTSLICLITKAKHMARTDQKFIDVKSLMMSSNVFSTYFFPPEILSENPPSKKNKK